MKTELNNFLPVPAPARRTHPAAALPENRRFTP